MKKSSKKLLSYALSFCICFTASAGSINAESTKALSDDILSVSSDLVSKVSLFDVSSADRLWAKYYTYEVTEDSEIMITGTVSDTKTDLIIPDYIDDMPVSVIGEKAFYNKGINSIQLPSNLKKIGNSAFKECGITSVDISKTMITEIGDYAFSGCKIGEITFPDTLETIGNYSFANTNLKTVYVPDSVKSIGKGCFYNCNSLLYADTGNGITTINEELFEYCNNIRQIHISDNTQAIGDYVFFNCSKLEIVNLPSGVEVIGGAFDRTSIFFTLSGYKEVYEKAYGSVPWMPFIEPLEKNEKVYESTSDEWEDYYDYVITAENDVLILGAKNNSSRNIVIPESIEGRPVTAISAEAFYNTPVTSVEFPETLKRIGINAFSNCSISSLNLPESIEIIRKNSFEGNDVLKKLTIPGNTAYIESGAFSNCTALEKITLDSGLTEINGNVFENCTSLKSVTVPETVTSIDDNAFSGCENLNTIYGKPETYAEEYAFINNYEFIDSDEISDDEPEYSSGDINGDGSVSVSDMLLLKRYILLADTEINERADINKDGKINIFDFARLKNIILTPIKDDTEVTSEWKKAYLQCINENTDPQNIKYSLAYIDNDEIPELIIGNEYYTGTGICGLYSFYNNSLVELESLSFRKYMSKYIEKGNAFIINWFWLADEGHIAFRIENGVTVETDSFSHSRQTGEYSINDKVVSEEEYNLKYQEYTSSFSEVKYCTYSEIIEQLN
ncbi:MAG: leucine-rich repeat protein [Oscillospiraceae bacterium]